MGARRAFVLVMDGVGAGAAVDADAFGDAGADTLGHVCRAAGGLSAAAPGAPRPGRRRPARGGRRARRAAGALVGRLAERSAGKDTTTGHWELMGLRTDQALPVYPDGFPPEIMEPFARRTGRAWLGNAPASGTEVIERSARSTCARAR